MVLGALAAVLVVIVAGGLWYFSGRIGDSAVIPQPDAGFAMTVTAIDDTSVSYADVPGGWGDHGLSGLAAEGGGYLQTSDPVTTGEGDARAGTRTITAQVLPPDVAVGDRVALDGSYFPVDPKVGLGLDYETVLYDSPLGPTPAWYIPGTASTWVVFVHGRGETPREGLRIASTVAPLGYPMLLIQYRNDPQAPSGNGYGQFGVDEWQDLEAAVQYALDNGAERVVLAGASMGGATSLAFLENSALADRVVGAFLDSPMSSFPQIVTLAAQDMGLPAVVASGAMQVASWRYGFDADAADYASRAAGFTTPMLIVQGTEDGTVPPEVNADFAAAAGSDTVTLELFEGAGHMESWNVDRARYDALLAGFLAQVAPSR